MKWFQSKWLREVACKIFGHAPAFASLHLPNCCITRIAPMAWNPGTERWDVLQRTESHDEYKSHF